MPSPADRALALVREIDLAIRGLPAPTPLWLTPDMTEELRAIIRDSAQEPPMPSPPPAPNFPVLVTAVVVASRVYVEGARDCASTSGIAFEALRDAVGALSDATVGHAVQEWARATKGCGADARSEGR